MLVDGNCYYVDELIMNCYDSVYTYRDCGTFLLQEFGTEKFNLSYTQYAMILSDVDEVGNTWVFKFCNKEKCLRECYLLHLSFLHRIRLQDTPGPNFGTFLSIFPVPGSSSKLFIVSCAVVVGMAVGIAIAKAVKVFDRRRTDRDFPPIANVEIVVMPLVNWVSFFDDVELLDASKVAVGDVLRFRH
ncbi:unnamed protein product [Haemonchus placei]|uniref:ZP domain-containing protein n=1 Tax=Haemonchus placei TaxID=6290 RepID=A0A0N4WC47_HAEPC|nr:unnamed protein product [Haemonchus placei]